jgi:hypothetical protein
LNQSQVRFHILKECYEQKMKVGIVSPDSAKWAESWSVSKREIEVAIIYLVKRGALNGEFVGGTDVPVVWDISDIGMDDYESQLKNSDKHSSEEPGEPVSSTPNPRNVFVVHGRNEQLRLELFSFLRAIDLNPIEFSRAVSMTGNASPYVGEILDAAFRNAQAAIVLMTPDDEA